MENLSNLKTLSRNELRKLIGGAQEEQELAPNQARHCGEMCAGTSFYCVDTYCNNCAPAFNTYVCSV